MILTKTNIKTIAALSFFVLLFPYIINKENTAKGQNPDSQVYHVFFSDKQTLFDPYEYFDVLAIERRIKHGISLNDSTDYPVNPKYLEKLSILVDSISFASRWFNMAFVYANPEQIKKVTALPFVKIIEESQMHCQLSNVNSMNYGSELSIADEELREAQLSSLQAELFREKGIDGAGIRIAVFDGGFPGVDKIPAFEHLRKNNRIIKTFDFTRNKEYVYKFNNHGTMVLSCIAGIIDDKPIGMATAAEFLLARTEINAEPFSEEKNWLAAAEWADKNGAHIINSSLGYTYHRYFPWDMDGKKSLVSRAANMAASKGILVVNAAGNEGSGKWKYIGAPADADSVLSIGGINPETKTHTSFSSFGPTADKRRKPNVSAYGHTIVASPTKLTTSMGTSFASPLVAGFAACVMQLKPDLKAMTLFKEIEKSGHLYPYYDYAHGYGMPQASYFLETKLHVEPSFSFVEDQGNIFIVIEQNIEDIHDYVYCKITAANGQINEYWLISADKRIVFSIPASKLKNGESFEVFYKSYYSSYKLK